jgi:hypothetical protein
MIQIKYENEFLDLSPGQSLEIERNNPMFMIENIFGEYSTPISFPLTETNVRLLGKMYFDLSPKSKLKLSVEVYDGGNEPRHFAFNATLVINASVSDRRVPGRAKASGYLLIGMSRLINILKTVKAKTLKLETTAAFTTFDPTDGSNGFIQQFHESWNNTLDYVIAPVQNSLWYGIELDATFYSGFMNNIDVDGYLQQYAPVVLFPRAKVIIEEILKQNGYAVDSSAMAGTGWEDIFIFSVKPFDYRNFFSVPFAPLPSITFNLFDSISPELTCSDVLIGLCKKYGWVPLLDPNKDSVQIVPLKNAGDGALVDLTKYASTQVNNDFSEEERIFSFKNTFGGNDDAVGSAPDMDGIKFGSSVFDEDDLPDPSSGQYDLVKVFVYKVNRYFEVTWNDTTNLREWQVWSENIYDEEVDDATDTFESIVTTLPVYKTEYRVDGGIHYYGYFPFCRQSQSENWGLRTLLYNGLVTEEQLDGSAGVKQYPVLSCVRVLPDGTEVAPFSNVFRHPNPNNSDEDLGIIEYWFRPWLNMISNPEKNEEKIFLPLHILKRLRWSNRILLFNIPYLMRSFTEPRSYTGMILAKLQRLTDAVTAVATGPTIYVRLEKDDIITGGAESVADAIYGGSYEYTNIKDAKIFARFYSDAAGTIPIAVVNLNVKFRYDVYKDAVLFSDSGSLPTSNANGVEQNYMDALFPGAGFTRARFEWDYAHPPSGPTTGVPEGHYLYDFYIAPSADYVVIP